MVPTQISDLTATTTQAPTCLWTLSSPWSTVYPKMPSSPWSTASPWSTVCPKMPPPTVGDPSVEAASFLSNRTRVASSSRLGTYPISSPSSPPANPLALQPGPLACRLVRSSNWALPTTALGSLAADSFKCAKCGNRVNVRCSNLDHLV